MNILHISAHLGDGAGKAISGLAILGSREGCHIHRILLLQEPYKLNYIEKCRSNGVDVLSASELDSAVAWAEVVVVSYWANDFLNDFTRSLKTSRPLLIWYHNNGFAGLLMPDDVLDKCGRLLITSSATLEMPRYAAKKPSLVCGFGDFDPQGAPSKNNYQLYNGKFVIGCVGTPSYKRLPDDFTDYAETVIKQIPNAYFVMVGEHDGQVLRDLAERGLAEHFTFTGWQSDAVERMRSFDVFGYLMRPDTTASMDNSVLEAMAAGLPVVISDEPIGRRIVKDGETGVIVNSPHEYAKALRRLFERVGERERLGTAARQYAIRHCDAAENLRRFDAAVMDAANGT
jgi:glycosyltransferase involved in cell wall biosynthesis